jgi:hypothetical protein
MSSRLLIVPPILICGFLVIAGRAADGIEPGGRSKTSLARDRLAANWVLQRAGVIGVLDEGGHAYSLTGPDAKAPDRSFQLIHVQFPRLSIDSAGEPDLDFADRDLKVLDGLESLTSLQIAGTAVTGEFVTFLANCPQLGELAVLGENVRDSALGGLTTLKSVRHLSLGGPKLTGRCLDAAAQMQRLESLAYRGTGGNAKGFSDLRHAKSLRSLSIAIDDLPGGVVESFALLPQVSELRVEFESSDKRRDLLEPLRSMPALDALELSTDLSDADLLNVSRAERLRSLTLGRKLASEESLAHLRSLPELRQLGLFCRALSPGGLRYLDGLKTVTELRLQIDTLNDTGCAHLSQLSSLASLNILSGEFNGEGLSRLARLPNLAELRLDGLNQNWTDAGKRELAALQQLRKLTLYGSFHDDGTLAQVARLRDLKALRFSGKQVTDEGLKHLTGLKNLTELGAAGTKISDDGLSTIGQIASLESLSISSTRITGKGFQFLESLPRLRTLALNSTGIGPAGLANLKPLTNLRRFSIYEYDGISPECLGALSALTRLDELVIDAPGAGSIDVTEVRKRLPRCKVTLPPAQRFAFQLPGHLLVLPSER